MLSASFGAAAGAAAVTTTGTANAAPASRNGRINQSIVHWCYQAHWDVEETCRVAKQLGCKGLELIDPKDWGVLKKYDLVCALTGSHWFDDGMNNPKHQPMCIEKIRKAIDDNAQAGFKNIITFTGFAGDIDPDDGIENCIAGYKKIIGHAEKHGQTLQLEMLNSRVSEEMKGHPGYQGDHTEYVLEIVKGVGSPSLKLLFDVYHVQIMDGDVIARIREHQDYIGHYHVAGNPGRGELDDNQEINFPPVLRAIAETGFTGYVGQEFIPTGDPLKGLTDAVALCDV